MKLELRLFGRPRVVVDGSTLDLRFERRHQLLAYLALKGSWVGRGELACLLWPGVAAKLAHANLRKTLFRLHQLRWPAPVEMETDAVRFIVDTDVAQFEAALRDGRAQDALRFRAHELMAGFDDAGDEWSAWLRFERERLRSLWRAAAGARLDAATDAGEAVAISTQLMEADPTDEDALRAHMGLLVRAGQAAAARRAYDDFVRRLRKDFGLAPSARLQALHASLCGDPDEPGAAPVPHDAAPDDGFIGRSRELRHIDETLSAGDCRLLSIVGPDGVGKTRLARRVLRLLGPRYTHGTAFVSLEGAAAPADVASAIARDVGASVAGAADPLAQAIEHLREREVLIALDDFEPVAQAAPLVQRLRDECPRVQVVVTSRARLALPGEWSLPLEGLPCPDAEDGDRLEAFDAARLFLQSARRLEPAFVPSAEAAAIIAICREVDGLPLALELAASWTRALSCEAIAAELRQGSMEVVFEQSWALLSAAERDALSRLSVFRGGFTPDAATHVAGAALPVLMSLVDKSLLCKEGRRLCQHPLIRQLSLQRLAPGQRRRAEAAHAGFFHTLLEQLYRPLDLGEREALERVDAEFENCRAAWQWSTRQGDFAPLIRSAPALRTYCVHRALLREARDLLAAALDDAPPGAAMAGMRVDLARVQYRFGNHPEAVAAAQEALGALHGSRDRETRQLAHAVLGCAWLAMGRIAQAEQALRDGLKATAQQDMRMASVLLGHLARVEKHLGRFREAGELSRQALERSRAAGHVAGEALTLTNLGELELDRGDCEAAKTYLAASLRLCEPHGFVTTRMLALTNLADACLRCGDRVAARRHAQEALAIAQATGGRSGQCRARLQLFNVELGEPDLHAARAELRRAAELANIAGEPSLQIDAAICFGALLAAGGRLAGAAAVWSLATAHECASATHRARVDSLVAKWRTPQAAKGVSLDLSELAGRIASEAAVAHAPLLASLRAACER